MQILRKIIFYAFIIIYAVICPLLIAYSLGYIIDPVKKAVERGGLIYISTVPSGADVYLGRSRYKTKTPGTINGLLPGEYRLSIRLKKYKKWAHAAHVEAGKATVFKDVILVPERWKVTSLGEERYSSLMPVTGTDTFVVTKGHFMGDYFIYSWKKSMSCKVVPVKSPLARVYVNSISASKRGGAINFDIGPPGNKRRVPVKINIAPLSRVARDAKELVLCKGKSIRQCYWVDDAFHVILLDSDDLYLLELGYDASNHMEYITRVLSGTQIFYSPDTAEVYYLECTAGKLEKIKIIQNR